MTSLVVPIDVAALCVGKPDPAMGLGPVADFSQLPDAADPGAYTSTEVLRASAPFAGEVPLPVGIHLHWALPDGLTHARAGAHGLQFPAAPDRWLVTRIVIDADHPAALQPRSWVVESDRLSQNPTAGAGLAQPTVPIAATVEQSFRYLGQAFAADGWSEQGAAAERLASLTAVGYGEPTFAALYSNSSTVFGYYDALDDIEGMDPARRTISYHVAGWYAARGADPLSSGAIDPGENPFRWRWGGGPAPTATVCSGIVAGITWDPSRGYLNDPPKPLSVAIGASAQEAISALIASAPGLHDEVPHAEWLLNALQFGLLARTGETGGVQAHADAVHEAGFARLPGGSRWALSSGGAERPAVPPALAAALDALNQRQQQLDALTRELQARQEQLFADWHKYLLVIYEPQEVAHELQPPEPGQDGDPVGQVQMHLQAEIDQINEIRSRIKALQLAIDQLAEHSQPGDGPTLTTDATAPRHYQPADPVLVLCGADASPPARYGGDGKASPDQYLPCRLDTQLVSAVTIAESHLPAAALPVPAGVPSPLLAGLVREALLLTAATQPAVAAAIAAREGAGSPAAPDAATLARAAGEFLAGRPTTGVTYTGTAPDAMIVNTWAGTPWIPVRLDYELSFAPVHFVDPDAGGEPYDPAFVETQFQLDPDPSPELRYTGPAPARSQPYLGTAILSPKASVDLAAEIERHLANAAPDPERSGELSEVLARLARLPVLSQRLTGALQAMLMRSLTLQMPVDDPLASPWETFPQDVADAVGDQTSLAAVPHTSFNPIRAGTATVTRLRLVDAFGRHKDYPPCDDPPLTVIVADSLRPPEQLDLPAGVAFLPPRITQPARLQFRWLAAGDDSIETNDDPATTPVAGWLLPLWLDRRIALHAPDGTPVLHLTASADRRRALWSPAPGGRFAPGTTIETVLADHPPELRAFALAAYNGGNEGSFLAPFIDAVREALTFTLPAAFRESAEAAVLAGQPLALARASLRLELAAPPATDQSWPSFVAQVLDGAAGKDANLGNVRFPVRLGALTRLDDTLVGFWTQDDGAQTDYGTFYAPAAHVGDDSVKPPTQETIRLTPAGDQSTTTVTLLLDPRGCVHAGTGVLPMKSISIPPVHYAGALPALIPTLAVHPVLAGGGPGGPALALPKLSAGGWSWVAAASGAWTTAPATDASSQATLDYTPQRILEGWLAPTPDDPHKP
jgi:hypothetical protein